MYFQYDCARTSHAYHRMQQLMFPVERFHFSLYHSHDRNLLVHLQEAKKYRDNYVEFSEREVVEEYNQDALRPFGRVFIIKGNERGNWFYGEGKK